MSQIFLSGASGRLWDQPNEVNLELTALVSIFHKDSPFSLTAFSPKGEKFAAADAQGSIYLVHILSNRFAVEFRLSMAIHAASSSTGFRYCIEALASKDLPLQQWLSLQQAAEEHCLPSEQLTTVCVCSTRTMEHSWRSWEGTTIPFVSCTSLVSRADGCARARTSCSLCGALTDRAAACTA